MAGIQRKKKRARRRRTGDEYISDDGDFGEDLLSELPDEILISILSRLTLREAAATSVLSQRWRYLWTYTSRLNFDSVVNKIVRRSHSFALSTAAGRRRRRRRRKYIKWVHKVLAKYRGGRNLDEFRVCFDLSKRSRSDIDKWFEFAMSKNVKNLEFDFLRCSSQNQDRDPWFVMLSYFQNFYKFPHRILGVREARDPNERKGDLLPNNMHIENSPLLVEVLAGVGRLGFAKNMLLKLSSCVHQLQILQLTVDHFFPERSRAYLLPKLRNLKQLKLTVFVGCPENCLLGFVAMLKKCPHLESLVLQLKWRTQIIPVAKRYAKALIQYSHQYLKLVKIVGFNDCSSACELVMQIIENAIALEKIIIDTSQGHRRRGPWLKRQLAARTRAEQLKSHVPPSLEFIVL
ncbi:F-box/LRR-repeat protein [Vitis vinifera]|uniref:F-box/LRR-repeat protein n=1 Tax=Vitis vinifera TaxID=29760 RepID=A0A438H4K7_VITVI|nr:F-box/LRR-repeat protein [Vitis vinifera]